MGSFGKSESSVWAGGCCFVVDDVFFVLGGMILQGVVKVIVNLSTMLFTI